MAELSDGLGEQLKTLSLRWEDGPNGRPGGEQSGVILAGDLTPFARCTRLTALDLSNASKGSIGQRLSFFLWFDLIPSCGCFPGDPRGRMRILSLCN